MSLSARIIGIIVCSVILASLLTGYSVYSLSSKAFEEKYRENIVASAKRFADGATIALLFKDPVILKRLAAGLLSDKSIDGVVVKDSKNKVLVKLGKIGKHKVEVPVYTAGRGETLIFVPSNKRIMAWVIVYYNKEPLRELLKSIFWRIGAISAFVIILMCIISYRMLKRSVLEPINSLVDMVKAVEQGVYDLTSLKVRGIPEIELLYQAFREMISSVKEHQRLLESYYQKMAKEKTLADIGKFAFTIAHEIKNPLGIIKGSIDLLKKEGISEEDKKNLLKFIEEEVHRIDLLIKDFLQLAKFKDPNYYIVELESVLKNIAERFSIKEENINIVLECPENLKVRTDPEKLVRILENLIRNSIEAGAKQVLVKCFKENGKWGLLVEDNGQGIKEEDMEKIFEPFYTTKHSGTGLGLTVVSHEIYRMRGEIEAYKASLGGAGFKITFPEETGDGSDTDSGR